MLKASLAGICYPAERKALLDYVRGWFDKPDSAPWTANGNGHSKTPLSGVIAPHIDFRVNTSVYAKAFAPRLAAPPADKVLILGVGHHARQEWSLDNRDYVTPLGEARADKSGLERLATQLPEQLWKDGAAHVKEHSIEFPLVCLQALRALRGIDMPFEFVPVLCGGLFEHVETGSQPGKDSMLNRLGAALRDWRDEAKSHGQRVEVIVSIDGCHIGPRFGHPFEVDDAILEDCNAWEEELWRLTQKGDRAEFLKFLHHDGNARYFDGVGALALVMTMGGAICRTGYAQWFEEHDASAVTFSSGTIS